ncbi:MAG: hypothetical protein EA402_11745 [Planctomycetota bacterium]|nr:MAG: hypothetical protein EA402_11745 [Planctomycetota bacterium]
MPLTTEIESMCCVISLNPMRQLDGRDKGAGASSWRDRDLRLGYPLALLGASNFVRGFFFNLPWLMLIVGVALILIEWQHIGEVFIISSLLMSLIIGMKFKRTYKVLWLTIGILVLLPLIMHGIPSVIW